MKGAKNWLAVVENTGSWLAASVFFLSGCIMYSVPALVRGQLYGGHITSQYPSDWVERLVPNGLRGVGNIAFFLAFIAFFAPIAAKLFASNVDSGEKR